MGTTAIVVLSIVGVILVALAVALPVILSDSPNEPEEPEPEEQDCVSTLPEPHGCFLLTEEDTEKGFYTVGAKKDRVSGACMSDYNTAKDAWGDDGEASVCGQEFLKGFPIVGYETTRDGSGVPEMAFYNTADPTQCEMNTVYNNSGNTLLWKATSMPVGTQLGVAASCNDALLFV